MSTCYWTSYNCILQVGRGVPVIIPNDTEHGLIYLTYPNVRLSAGIEPGNEYIFALQGMISNNKKTHAKQKCLSTAWIIGSKYRFRFLLQITSKLKLLKVDETDKLQRCRSINSKLDYYVNMRCKCKRQQQLLTVWYLVYCGCIYV